MLKAREVALLIETSRGYGRDVTLGIARFARLHGPWSFHLKPGDFQQAFPRKEFWHGDGVFARLENARIIEDLLAADLPTVALDMRDEHLEKSHPLRNFSELRVDSEAASELVAAHLLERRYPHFAFVGSAGKVWSDRREARFGEVLRAVGHEVHIYQRRMNASHGWEGESERLSQWVESLPKPVGVMACNDEHGLHLLDACRRAEASVPGDVGVVGVDNDTMLCELCNPTLSSVVLNGVEGGFQAAAWLNTLMKKGRNKHRSISVAALRIATRQSTDLQSIDRKEVAHALKIIKQSRGLEITPDSIAELAQVSRRELDSSFQEQIGRSVAAEIQRARLDHARQLLEETDYSIPEIAEAAGYSSASYLNQVFRRELDTTPTQYRSKVRRLSASPPQSRKEDA